MAPRDELGDRREPVELGNSVGSDADAALTFKAVHGRVVMSHSTVRLGNGSSMRFTELHCVNLSPENRFEASPFTREFNRLVSIAPQTSARSMPTRPLPTIPAQSGEHANKFTEKGTVTIAAHQGQENGRDWITIAVSDTGI